jgi:hypothetical protein
VPRSSRYRELWPVHPGIGSRAPFIAVSGAVAHPTWYRELCPVHRGVIAMSGFLGAMSGPAGPTPLFPSDAPSYILYFNCRIRSCRNCRSGSCWVSARAFSYEDRASSILPSLRYISARAECAR